VLDETLRLTGYVAALEHQDSEEAQGRIENVNELTNVLAGWVEENPGGGLSQFLEEASLVSDVDALDSEAGQVSLMTLHSAKGLEAPHVFITGLEEGIIPSRQNFDDERRVEEERRLFYVGSTRAISTLICSRAELRWRFGSIIPMEPSRFLDAIPPELYRSVEQADSAEAAVPGARRTRGTGRGRRREPSVEFDEFCQETVQYCMGQHVRHELYGIGRILSISGFGKDMRMTVLFNDGERRRMMAKFANLEVV
jgi:DNA helicase-2/ATP-dependent DNA helicase PcrA